MKKLLFILVALSLVLGACGGNYQPAKDCRAWVGENVVPVIEKVREYDQSIRPDTPLTELDVILAEEQVLLADFASLEEEVPDACGEYNVHEIAGRLIYLYVDKHFRQWAMMEQRPGVGIHVLEAHMEYVLSELESAVSHTPLVLFGGVGGIVVKKNGNVVHEVGDNTEHGNYPFYTVPLHDAEYESYSPTGEACVVLIDRVVVKQALGASCIVNLSDYMPELVSE